MNVKNVKQLKNELKMKNKSKIREVLELKKKEIFRDYRRRMEEMKIIAEQERNERLAERQRKIDAGEPMDDEDEAAEKGL